MSTTLPFAYRTANASTAPINDSPQTEKQLHGEGIFPRPPDNSQDIAWSKEEGNAIRQAKLAMGDPAKPTVDEAPDWAIAKLLFLISSTMYLRDTHPERRHDQKAIEETKSWDNWCGPFSGAFYQTGDNPFIVVAFKGTTDPLEWINDLTFWTTDRSASIIPGDVHVGFDKGLFEPFEGKPRIPIEIIINSINKLAESLTLNSTDLSPIPVYLTGHSLGAAYATLSFAAFLRLSQSSNTQAYWYPRSIYTFGGPRVGLKSFALPTTEAMQSQKSSSHRIVVGQDPVPWLVGWVPWPPWDPKGYFHLDGGLRLGEGIEGGWEKLVSELGLKEEEKMMVAKRCMGDRVGAEELKAPFITDHCKLGDHLGMMY